jgi:hypothetical protein
MTDKKNIEDWVKSNKGLFDDKELPVGHRELFEGKLDSLLKESTPKKTNSGWYNIAAVFVVGIAILSSVLYLSNDRSRLEKTYASAENFEEVENHYSEKIKEALVPVRSSNKYLSPEYRSFLKEMEKLDVENERLKELLINFPDDERILNSIIENYKSRLQLLEQLKVIMSNKQISKNRTDESI